MPKLKKFFSLSLSLSLSLSFFLLALPTFLFAADTVTITTYYPSPYGSYRQLYVSEKLGIGTTGPLSSLHSYVTANNSGIYVEGNISSNVQTILISPNNSSGAFIAGCTKPDGTTSHGSDGCGRIVMQNGGAEGFQFATSNVASGAHSWDTKMVIKNNGNVGIGTTSPGNKLDIRGTAATLGINAAQLWLSRATPATQAQGINFRAGPSADYIVGRLANSDDLVFGPDYGGDVINERVRFTASGNVGIGTTSPSGKLDVNAGTRSGTHGSSPSFYVSGPLSPGQSGPAAGNIEFRHDNGTQGIGFGYNTIYQTGSNTNQELNILSRGNSPITLNAYGYSTGNVGIGTTGPDRKLVIQEGTTAEHQLFLKQNNANHGYTLGSSAQDGDLRFARRVDGTVTETVRFTAGGNVGIGTTSPSTKLQVAGPMIRTIAYAQGYGTDTSCDNEDTTCSAALAARVLTFNKTSASTKVRVAWVDTMRSYSVSPASVHVCAWELRFNGASCPSGKIRGIVYSYPPEDKHATRTVWGYCAGLAAGTYTVQGYVGAAAGSPGRCYTGWDGGTNWTIEAEEVN